ncbi:MAG: biopolymer transporter ExbD [Planctomycetes bacterium]|nr:biopolymer transporter ExbD [Planctomycetota bacterium]
MAIKRHEAMENAGFNMTPMIDICFQLIIFFMLATDMSQQNLEAVILPDARTADEDKKPDKDRLVVNICHDNEGEADNCDLYRKSREARGFYCMNEKHWVIKIKRKKFAIPALAKELEVQAAMLRDAQNPEISNRPIMIRADGCAPYEQVQNVMTECGRYGIWKIEIGARVPEGTE